MKVFGHGVKYDQHFFLALPGEGTNVTDLVSEKLFMLPHDMKTLLIEDHAAERLLFEEYLRSFGYDVMACATAETAVAAYRKHFYPLILLDLGLPGREGLACCRRIRALPQGAHSVILVIAGADDLKPLQAALHAGANDYLIKPVTRETLQMRLTIVRQQIRPPGAHHQMPALSSPSIPLSLTLRQAVEAFEKQLILQTLEQHHWHKVHTAQALGIGRKTLYRKLQQHGLLDG